MKNTYTNNAMIGPITVPAVKGILDALALGTAAYGTSQAGNQDYKTRFIQNHDYEIQEAYRQALKEVSDKLTNRQMTVPIAENALVLRPEYRTTTIPVDILNTIGYKPVWNDSEDSGDALQQSGTQASGTPSASGGNPKPDDKDKKIKELEEKIKQLENKSSSENKSGFKKGLTQGWNFSKKIGSYGLQSVGIGIGGGLVVGIPAGVYYGGKALLGLADNKEDNDSNSSSSETQEQSEQTYNNANLKEMAKRRKESRIKTDSLNNAR